MVRKKRISNTGERESDKKVDGSRSSLIMNDLLKDYTSDLMTIVHRRLKEKPVEITIETNAGKLYSGIVVQSNIESFYWSLIDVSVSEISANSTISHMDSVIIPGTKVRYIILGDHEENHKFFSQAYTNLCEKAKNAFEKRVSQHEARTKFKTLTAHNQSLFRKKTAEKIKSDRANKAKLFDVFRS